MYNEEQKKRYLEFKTETNNFANSNIRPKFELSEAKEKEYGKDLCEFDLYEIVEMYKTMLVDSFIYLKNMNLIFIEYVDWCIKNNLVLDATNHYMETASNDVLKKCLNMGGVLSKIITRDELLECIDKLNNPRDQFLLIAVFEGIYGGQYRDIIYCQKADFDEDTKIFNGKSGASFEVSDELLYYMNLSNKSKIYIPVSVYKYEKDLFEENYVVKNIKYSVRSTPICETREDKLVRRLIGDISNALTEADLDFLSGFDIRESGKLDYIKNKMKQDNLPIEDVLKKYDNDITVRYGKIKSRKDFINLYKDLL